MCQLPRPGFRDKQLFVLDLDGIFWPKQILIFGGSLARIFFEARFLANTCSAPVCPGLCLVCPVFGVANLATTRIPFTYGMFVTRLVRKRHIWRILILHSYNTIIQSFVRGYTKSGKTGRFAYV
jgi:hypothetical protein